MCSVVNTVLCTWKLLRVNLKCSHHTHMHTQTHTHIVIMKGSVQSLSCVRLFVTLCTTAALQASLSINNSQILLKLMSIEFVMPCKVRAVLTSFIVIIISQYICVSSHHVTNLKHTQCYKCQLYQIKLEKKDWVTSWYIGIIWTAFHWGHINTRCDSFP